MHEASIDYLSIKRRAVANRFVSLVREIRYLELVGEFRAASARPRPRQASGLRHRPARSARQREHLARRRGRGGAVVIGKVLFAKVLFGLASWCDTFWKEINQHEPSQRNPELVCPQCGGPWTSKLMPQSTSELTVRERQVHGLLVSGLANKEIAQQLNISVQTVKNHVHNVLRKSQVKNRAALVEGKRP